MITKSDIKKAASGDEAAMEKIYQYYSAFVWNVALKTCLNRDVAADALQEVFIKVFKKLGSFRFYSSLKTWIYRITVNTTLNLIKKEKRREGLELDCTRLKARSGEPDLESKQTAQELLGTLDPEDRILIVMREMEGMSYKEIAASSKMTLSSVKTRIYRAREKMRTAYDKR